MNGSLTTKDDPWNRPLRDTGVTPTPRHVLWDEENERMVTFRAASAA